MAEQQWCLLWAAPCLSSGEWAAWAQAVFSALAILAAFGVVWWQLHVTKRQARATAKLVATGLLNHMNQIIGGLQTVENALLALSENRDEPINAPRYLSMVLSTLPLPSTEDLLALNAELPGCAVLLMRARNSARQIQSALDIVGDWAQKEPPPAHILRLPKKLASEAREAFEDARAQLDAFSPI